MSFARTETQAMLAEMTDRLLADRNEFETRRRRLEGENPDRMELWPELAAQGILGASFPEGAGGFGGSTRDLATVMQSVGRHLVVEPVLASAIVGGLLHTAGADIDDVIAGDRVLASPMTRVSILSRHAALSRRLMAMTGG